MQRTCIHMHTHACVTRKHAWVVFVCCPATCRTLPWLMCTSTVGIEGLAW